MNTNVKEADKERQAEMAGVLTAMSIVSKRLANRLLERDEEPAQEGATQDE